jgi:spore coat protein A, manganese oxidase
MITRRRFVQAGAAGGALLALPIRAFPFSQSVMPIFKFRVPLPGLVADGSSTRGIPVLAPTKTLEDGTQVYEIEARGFEQDLLGAAARPPHALKLWGYAGLGHTPQYLGGVIVATQGTPIQLQITNNLENKHILPVDISLIDRSVINDPGMKRQDKITVHLHGGFVFWQFDGGPFTYFTSVNGGFQHGTSFLESEQLVTAGTAKYDYPNDQSPRTIWYHDHAYGLTRTNVYAGLASAYLITDSATNEATTSESGPNGLIARGILPGAASPPFDALTKLGIPLIVQDKTFWDPASRDPGYGTVPPAGAVKGDLWYPHVYEGELLANLPDMAIPPSAPLNNARWETSKPGAQPKVSSVPEFFSDTILVNGAPYPTLNVQPRRYRFRFVNASQGRVYNLQLYVGDPTNPDGVTIAPDTSLTGLDALDVNGNPILKPTNANGPAFVQVANEAGFLPNPVVFNTGGTTNENSNLVLLYKNASDVRTRRRRADSNGNNIRLNERSSTNDPTFGNANQHNLLMAPAERPDVIIDFAGFAGKELILYNDAPAPFPGGDTRNDYFAGAFSPDLTSIGGAPPTLAGRGPDTRIMMKFIVGRAASPPAEKDFATWLGELKTELPLVFAATQPTPFTDSQLSAARTLDKTLGEDMDEFGRLRQYLGNPVADLRTYLDFPSEVALVNEIQVWRIFNTTADTHPMHFHLVNVQVVGRDQWAFDSSGAPIIGPDGKLQILGGTHTDPEPNERGWRETVRMNPGEVTTVAMQFTLPSTGGPPPPSPRILATYGIKASEYVWHCHILEHEEHDMMRPVVVLPG